MAQKSASSNRRRTKRLRSKMSGRHILATILFLSLVCGGIGMGQSIDDAKRQIENKQFDAARQTLGHTLKKEPKNAEAHYRLGRLLIRQFRNLDDGVEHLENAVELAGNEAEYHFELGSAYGQQAMSANIFSQMALAGNVKNEFLRAVELRPQTVKYRIALMQYYLQAPGIVGGSVSKAKTQAAELMKLNAYEGNLAYAQIASYEKDTRAAEQSYRDAITVDPKNWRAYHLLGYLFIEQKRAGESISCFRKYVEFAPDDPNSFDSLGDGFMAIGNTDSAIVAFRNAISINPNFSVSIYNLARCYEKKGMKQDAVDMYRQFLTQESVGKQAEKARAKIKELSHQ